MSFLIGLGATEIFIIFLVVLLLFGAKNIPKLARSLGRASKEFKNAKDDFQKELYKEDTPEINSPSESVSQDTEEPQKSSIEEKKDN